MKNRALYIIGAVTLIILGWFWTGYNGLVSSQGAAQARWADVETQYQRRFDLVPNLVNTVKGASNFEQSTFTAITQARSQWQSAATVNEKVAAAGQFDSALSRLLVTVEAYPQLQATQSYRDLMTQLEGTENRIAVARRDFNDAVLSYNIYTRRFPSNLLASLFGFEPMSLFQSAPGTETAPSVAF
jgi:LemA protein